MFCCLYLSVLVLIAVVSSTMEMLFKLGRDGASVEDCLGLDRGRSGGAALAPVLDSPGHVALMTLSLAPSWMFEPPNKCPLLIVVKQRLQERWC